MKAMETIQDLIEEAKVRTVWWALVIFSVTYFLSHTSSSMWMNLPIAVLFVSLSRILLNEVEFRWKSNQSVRPRSFLSLLEKKQLSPYDSRLSSAPPPPRWKRKIDSPVVEDAIGNFIDKILKDFVVDLWYSEITPDREAPELMRCIIMDAIAEISERVKVVNLVDVLTRDMIDLTGEHLDLFRRNQVVIGADVMRTLSTEQRDERLKHHLMVSKELHPALISPDSEYKFLQRLIGGVLALVLRPREAQCPIVRSISREIVTCLVMQPVMNLASPLYVNEVIELVLLAIDDSSKTAGDEQSIGSVGNSTSRKNASIDTRGTSNSDYNMSHGAVDLSSSKTEKSREITLGSYLFQQEPAHTHPADWARMLEVATQRRTEVLAPENLENLWAKGRNYKKREDKRINAGDQKSTANHSKSYSAMPNSTSGQGTLTNTYVSPTETDKAVVRLTPRLSEGNIMSNSRGVQLVQDGMHAGDDQAKTSKLIVNENKNRIKRSNSTSDLKPLSDEARLLSSDGGGPIISEFYSPNFSRYSGDHAVKKGMDIVLRVEGLDVPKLRCRVVGAYFEKLGSKSFAVYSIAVTDAESRTWFVKRRYRNFERLHRHLKEIPNYTLHLPPKRIFSSSTEDAFVHQRCIQLDKYLQDLLSIANVAEQHEVWDFLSATSKNYSFGESSSVMRTLAVNVDDAVDDIVRQFKGVSDGLMRKVVGSSSPLEERTSSSYSRNLSWHPDDMNKLVLRREISETLHSFSDEEETRKQESQAAEEVESNVHGKGWHSDNELDSRSFPSCAIKHDKDRRRIGSEMNRNVEARSEHTSQVGDLAANAAANNNFIDVMPPEWNPSNVSVPLLNLVDKVFQLQRRGWLRRQVFWISKQILQLIMEDAIDDWLLRQIYWIRREETVAWAIRWVQDVLWPNGIFFTRTRLEQSKLDYDQPSLVPFQVGPSAASKGPTQVSFEEQLEAARRASNIKKMLFDGAPAALVSLIGPKQYRRCARDIFYFTQSTICVKQLAYGILELLVATVFPELRDLLRDIHEQMPIPPV